MTETEKNKAFSDLATTKFVADILMAGELERFISKAKICLQEQGMYKQLVKRQINELIRCQRVLFINVQIAEGDWFTPIFSKCFPYYAKRFVSDGMSITRSLQSAFISETKDRTQKLYLNYKQLMDRHGISNSEVSAILCTISALSRIIRKISQRIYEQMEIALYGRVCNKHPQQMNDKIEHCVATMLKVLGSDNFEFDREEFDSIAEYIKGITSSLVSDDAAKLVCKVFEKFTFEYVEYCIAQMVIDAQSIGLPDKVRLDLNETLGKEGYSEWLSFLLSVEYGEDDDAVDVMDRLPQNEDGELITYVRQTLLKRLPYIEEISQ